MDGPQNMDDSGEDTMAQDSPQEEETLTTEDITPELFEEVTAKTQTVSLLILQFILFKFIFIFYFS